MPNLDRALLPKLLEGAQWPLDLWATGLMRWMDAFAPNPRLGDRLIECLARVDHLDTADGVELIQRMFGTHPDRIVRASQLVTSWLRIVLLERPEGLDTHRPALLIRTLELPRPLLSCGPELLAEVPHPPSPGRPGPECRSSGFARQPAALGAATRRPGLKPNTPERGPRPGVGTGRPRSSEALTQLAGSGSVR